MKVVASTLLAIHTRAGPGRSVPVLLEEAGSRWRSGMRHRCNEARDRERRTERSCILDANLKLRCLGHGLELSQRSEAGTRLLGSRTLPNNRSTGYLAIWVRFHLCSRHASVSEQLLACCPVAGSHRSLKEPDCGSARELGLPLVSCSSCCAQPGEHLSIVYVGWGLHCVLFSAPRSLS